MNSLIVAFKEALVPKGSEPVVRLYMGGSDYFEVEFIDRLIKEAENLCSSVGLEEPTAMQKLALHVLACSSCIK